MIFRVEVNLRKDSWQARITSPDDPHWNPIERSGALDPDGYPVPPAAETAERAARAASGDDASLALCDTQRGLALRKAAYERFVHEDPRAAERDVDTLGGYLFSVLLGKDWSTLAGDGRGALRLQLVLPPGSLFERLPWELMIGPSGPLVQTNDGVSIARIIATKFEHGPVALEIPLRVLFVLGRQLDDQLQPAAEYVSALRQLQCSLRGGNDVQGIALHTRLLMEATVEDLEKAVADFKPSVVHVITHGQVQNNEPVVLLTAYDGITRTKPRDDPVSAQRFADLVRASDPALAPRAVILNACNTAHIGDVRVSFAAELIRNGIPIVVGMAGEVADTACRLFTRRFYSALVQEQPADLAAAKGRRAALLFFKDYTQNYDWGRAVFCQADGVDTRFAVDTKRQVVIRAAEALRPKKLREPFYGRMSWLPLFHELFTGRLVNVAIDSDAELPDAQLGKTRLLEEIAWQSVMEGWIPLFIDETAERFSNLLHFGVKLVELLERQREETYSLPRAHRSRLVEVACDGWPDEITYVAGDSAGFMRVRDKVLRLLEPDQKLEAEPATIWSALREDFEALRSDVEAVTGPRRGVLVLWDQLDKQEAIGEDCVRALRPAGFGTPASPIPVAFTYTRRSAGARKLVDAMKSSSNIDVRILQTFSDAEARMACRQFFAWKNLVGARSNKELFDMSIVLFAKHVNGYPSQLYTYDQAMAQLVGLHVLDVCDEQQILATYG